MNRLAIDWSKNSGNAVCATHIRLATERRKTSERQNRSNPSRLIKNKGSGDRKAAKIKDRFMYAAHPSPCLLFYKKLPWACVYTSIKVV